MKEPYYCDFCGTEDINVGLRRGCPDCQRVHKAEASAADDLRGAPHGWTVCRNNSPKARKPYMVYKRDCPADAKHHAADLAPFTHSTYDAADEAGKAGNYAYKR